MSELIPFYPNVAVDRFESSVKISLYWFGDGIVISVIR